MKVFFALTIALLMLVSVAGMGTLAYTQGAQGHIPTAKVITCILVLSGVLLLTGMPVSGLILRNCRMRVTVMSGQIKIYRPGLNGR